MLARLGMRISRLFERTAPDPFVLAIVLTGATALLALTLGFDGAPTAERAGRLLDAWRIGPPGPDAQPTGGLWKFLAFGMQMCLILVTGHAVAVSKPVRAAIRAMARVPRSTAQAAAMVACVACLASRVNWGLCLIVGALLARDVGREMARRGVRVHYPLIAAAGYTGMMLWHGGLSGSAPLSVTTRAGAARVLSPGELAKLGEGGFIDLSHTVLSPLNLLVTGGLLLIVPIVVALLAPRHDQDIRPMAAPDDQTPQQAPDAGSRPSAFVRFLENSPLLGWLLALGLIAALVRFGLQADPDRTAFAQIGLDEVNAGMLALGLLLHGSPASYARAVEEGARGCAGIILQFPFYAGIMAMMASAGLIGLIARTMAANAGPDATPLLTFLSAGIVNLFVPSGGGQWGIQGPIALSAGEQAGVAPGTMVMAVAYGDQLTNMLQPFWALPLLAITGVKAREIVGYTCIVMLAGALWMGGCLLVLG